MGASSAFPHADSPRSGARVFPRGRDAGLATCRWASESLTSASRRGDLLPEDGHAASTQKNLRTRRRNIESDQSPREFEYFASSAAIHLVTEEGCESLEIQGQPPWCLSTRFRPRKADRCSSIRHRRAKNQSAAGPTEVVPVSRKPGVSNPSIRARARAEPGDMLPCEKVGRPISERLASTMSKPRLPTA
jgi:hypothetical protein